MSKGIQCFSAHGERQIHEPRSNKEMTDAQLRVRHHHIEDEHYRFQVTSAPAFGSILNSS
jgi:hypothetical protein